MKKGVNEKVKKSLNYSIIDGAFYSAMVGFGESFFSAFGVFLKATNLQLGLLGSLPQTLGSLSQLYSNRLLKLFKSRKKLVCWGAFIEALIYIPIILAFFFGKFKVPYLIFFVCLYWIFGAIIGPAWSSWMGDLVNEKERGSYFGRRNRIAGFIAFVSFLIAGYILQRFSNGTTSEYIGFAIIFVVALIARVASSVYLTKKYEPKYSVKVQPKFHIIDFLKKNKLRNYGLFVVYLALMNFAVFLAGPFFAAYMLYDLKFDYKTFTLVLAASRIVKFISMPLWGRISDTNGTKKVLTVTGFLLPFIPLLWLFSTNPVYLIIVEGYSGFIWAGFELATFNFLLDSTTPEKRATFIAYSSVLSGIAILFGGVIGSLIVKYNHVFWSKYLLVFLVSFALRYIFTVIFIPKLKEVRKVEKISYGELLVKMFKTMPAGGLMYSILTLGMDNDVLEKKKKNP
ncbi:MFS transporter [Candidatus Woesearchaeota archaeon]|nr:MFS transporter [Candidatus Woesearchaeota archaeon]